LSMRMTSLLQQNPHSSADRTAESRRERKGALGWVICATAFEVRQTLRVVGSRFGDSR
jgi:hypothetical protein